MDLNRMLNLCERNQWHADDLDWSVTPKALAREDEIAVVQYFTDMAGIELLAGKLFQVQRDRADDPVLAQIFDSFVVDELRHSEVATRLARHYDVHHYRQYTMNDHLLAFSDAFADLLQYLSAEIANAYITTGELLLDVALLRSIDDFVDDEMSRQAMNRINRDESRHIAMDYYMIEYYASPEGIAREAARPPLSTTQRLRGASSMARVFYHARPFFKDVFFGPMDHVDPGGKRLLEAFKRAQLIGAKPEVAARPFPRFAAALTDLANHPVSVAVFKPVVERVLGVDRRVIGILYNEKEEQWAQRASFDELANEALEAKTLN
ncbi:MAG: hypothetical protein KC668_23435 [Myxococcales bacterium]|nr:hypothetical protein [Myxococcales bacterium]